MPTGACALQGAFLLTFTTQGCLTDKLWIALNKWVTFAYGDTKNENNTFPKEIRNPWMFGRHGFVGGRGDDGGRYGTNDENGSCR
jgi:hypothetical protein